MLNTDFFKKIKVVFLGTLSSQLLSIGVLLILTRIFTPSDYALLTVFNSFAIIVPLFITGKFEFAIIAEKDDSRAQLAFSLVSLLSLILAPLTGLISYLVLKYIIVDFSYSKIYFSLLLIIFSVFQSQSLIRTLYLERLCEYKKRAFIIFISTLLSGVIVIGLGLQGVLGPYTLVLGPILNHLFILVLFKFYSKIQIRTSGIKTALEYGRSNKKYPFNLVPAGLFYTISSEYKTFATAKYYLPSEIGILGMYTKIEGLIHRVIGTTFSDVYRRQAAINYNNGVNNEKLFLKSFLGLLFLGLIPTSVFFFWGEEVFSLILGQRWSEAGRVASILAFAFLSTFCSSPLSTILHVTNSLSSALISHGFYFATLVVVFWFYFMNGGGGFYEFLEIISWLICGKSLLELIFSHRASRKSLPKEGVAL